MELEKQSYEIDEDDSNVELNATLQICVILTGEIETPVSVTVTSVNSTATGTLVIYVCIHTINVCF